MRSFSSLPPQTGGSANSSQRNSFSSASGVPVKPLSSPSTQQQPMLQSNMIIFGHDVDSVDVATRVAMVKLIPMILYHSVDFYLFRCAFSTHKMSLQISPSIRGH